MTTTREISQATGLNQNEIQSRMRKMHVEHDGSPSRAYPYDKAMRLITQHRQQNRSATRKRYAQATPLPIQEKQYTPAPHCECPPDVSVVERPRTNKDVVVNFRLGPTNSGKTYNALENLFEAYERNPHGKYVYAGPLRMLAFEVYEKMAARVGFENVGFLTGDSQVNPDAPLIACTVEMTPRQGDLMVLDEAHWCIQESRGAKWTHLMTQGDFSVYEILCSSEAVDIIRPLFEGATVNVSSYTRRTPITYGGTLELKDIPRSTAVVCFSRTKVFAIAEQLQTLGFSVGVLYGALPLDTRKDQVRRFVGGEYDVMVVTDVIGHGVNLPLDNVVFTETVKFDGVSRRKLMTWEGGQIAGRAGRFGLSDHGTVYLAKGSKMFSKDEELVKSFVQVASGREASDLPTITPSVSPLYEDLNLDGHSAQCLPVGLDLWLRAAENMVGFTPTISTDMKRNLAVLPYSVGTFGARIDAPDVLWKLLSLPLSSEGGVLTALHHFLATGSASQLSQVVERDVLSALGTVPLHALEKSVLTIGELKMCLLAFPDTAIALGGYDFEALHKRLSDRTSRTLRKELAQ